MRNEPTTRPELDALKADETLNPKDATYHEFKYNDLNAALRAILDNSEHNYTQVTKDHVAAFFALLDKNPNESITTLCKQSGLSRSTYYKLVENKAFAEQLAIARRMRVDADVDNAYNMMVRLTTHKDPKISFAASKFLLENNGQKYGFGKKEDHSGVLQIEVLDKREDKPMYSEDELQDV